MAWKLDIHKIDWYWSLYYTLNSKHGNIYIINLIYCLTKCAASLLQKNSRFMTVEISRTVTYYYTITHSKMSANKKPKHELWRIEKLKKSIKMCWSTPFRYSHRVGECRCRYTYRCRRVFYGRHFINAHTWWICALRKRSPLFAPGSAINIHFISFIAALALYVTPKHF